MTMVSIIVPVYNAENYLRHCVNSIKAQTYKNIEIILINDGSTDGSGDICNELATTDARIHVIHQENSGPAHARNRGLETAVGTYIQFVDADDTIQPTMTAQLVGAMKAGTDLVICGYQSIAMNRTTTTHLPSIAGIYPKKAFIQHVGALYKDTILPSPCNKLYLRNLINDYTIRFMESLRLGEDLLFNLAYLHVCTAVNLIKRPLYNYALVETSITRSFNKRLFENQQMLFDNVRAFLERENQYHGDNRYFLEVIYINSVINCLNNLFHQHSPLTAKQKKQQIAAIVADDTLKENGTHFKGSRQSRFVGRLINMQSIAAVYCFFKAKRFLQYRMPALFYLLKKANY
ncbi:glycosyltransferase involved in cell wall biosynthesis [Virgibacillus halotolerans]|uniref:glycosyltransferase family 2 protein n=1 Tax=Virgibacillus halotolerans TaxID=1071053 RepID=UPI001961F543|nr:glycosyltransferase family 2 protein [Virgibacillus halotolerans]MBM7600152.1 glycosyltransferase involved in cell wall biosynthesis [Virgibacillus halotolerans]